MKVYRNRNLSEWSPSTGTHYTQRITLTESEQRAYQLNLPSVQTLPQALLIFNVPFTLVKAACDVALTFAVYKRLSPLIHGVEGSKAKA